MKQLLVVVLLVTIFAVLGFRAGDVDTFPQIVDRSMQSVVEIHIEGYGLNGTGFYVGDGKVVTAGHITEDRKVSQVVFEDGTVCESLGQFTCGEVDCGIVFIDPIDKPALKFDTDGAVRGEDVFICGNPQGVTFLVSTGVVSKVYEAEPDGWWPNTTLIISSVPAHPGNSGSPLLDEDGEVIGVYVGSIRTTRCRAFPTGFAASVPTEDVLLVLEHAVVESEDGS
jgi:S1-C subfamily serine protease